MTIERRLHTVVLASLVWLGGCGDARDDGTDDDTGIGPGGSSEGGPTTATASTTATSADPGSEDATSDALESSGDDAPVGSSSEGSTGEATGPTFGDGSAFSDVLQMFAYVNEQRQGYLSHERWRGLPWTGSGHTMHTWPVTFEWDDGLAAMAQAEADALAAGAAPQGSPATDGLTPPIYVAGVDTAHSMVSGREDANSWEVPNTSSLSKEHGSARMAIFYHDPGGQGPVLTRLGIGAADAGDGGTWWTFVWE